MKEGFRQSMAWLHTWSGLLAGWVLYFVFLTGTFGYANAEVDRWMRPELPLHSTPPAAAQLLPRAEARLHAQAPDARFWLIRFPGERSASGLQVSWRARPQGTHESGQLTREFLDFRTGQPFEHPVRDTGGGDTLYEMHYSLHYVPYEIAIRIVGVCTMFMLVAILSGLVTHKKIFKDFFTFRPVRGQRSWLDGHNLLSVTALPFHLMITWSGLIFFLFTYMPVPLAALYPEGEARDAFYAQAYGFEREVDDASIHVAASLTSLAPLLAIAEHEWGKDSVNSIRIDHPGRDNAKVIFQSSTSKGVGRDTPSLRFDGVTGQRLGNPSDLQSGPGHFNSVILGLHEGRFAGPVLRLLYLFAGLAGTAMIGTGLVLWSTKRKQKLAQAGKFHYGTEAVEALNLGTIIGLPLGIVAYFWANRLLPIHLQERAKWEVHVMFIIWGLTFLYAIWRPLGRAWIELCVLAATACALLPVLNALTTQRHLGVTIPARDWVLASFDLFALGAGVFFAFLARTVHLVQQGADAYAAREARPASPTTRFRRHGVHS